MSDHAEEKPDEPMVVYVIAPVFAVVLLTSLVVVVMFVRRGQSSAKSQRFCSPESMVANPFYEGVTGL